MRSGSTKSFANFRRLKHVALNLSPFPPTYPERIDVAATSIASRFSIASSRSGSTLSLLTLMFRSMTISKTSSNTTTLSMVRSLRRHRRSQTPSFAYIDPPDYLAPLPSRSRTRGSLGPLHRSPFLGQSDRTGSERFQSEPSQKPVSPLVGIRAVSCFPVCRRAPRAPRFPIVASKRLGLQTNFAAWVASPLVRVQLGSLQVCLSQPLSPEL